MPRKDPLSREPMAAYVAGKALAEARNAALEEAAQWFEEQEARPWSRIDIAAAIRALKDQD